jgi:hypothetical protein
VKVAKEGDGKNRFIFSSSFTRTTPEFELDAMTQSPSRIMPVMPRR